MKIYGLVCDKNSQLCICLTDIEHAIYSTDLKRCLNKTQYPKGKKDEKTIA